MPSTSATPSTSKENTQMWYGYYESEHVYKDNETTRTVNIILLLDDIKPGTDSKKLTWYPEPHAKFSLYKDTGRVEIQRTFRSANYKRVGKFTQNTCYECKNIPNLQSFCKRALLRHQRVESTDEGRDTTWIRNDYLNHTEVQEKLTKQKKDIDRKESQIFFLTSKVARKQIQCRNYKEKLVEFSRRGTMQAVSYQLQKASDLGMLKDRSVLCGLLEAVARNLHVKKQGKRYPAPVQTFFDVYYTRESSLLDTYHFCILHQYYLVFDAGMFAMYTTNSCKMAVLMVIHWLTCTEKSQKCSDISVLVSFWNN